MSPKAFYEHKHGNEPFLSKAAIIQLMDDYDKRQIEKPPYNVNPNNMEVARGLALTEAERRSVLSGT